MSLISKILIISGAVLIVAGLLAAAAAKFGFPPRLPGDILIKKDNFTFYFPVVTCIVISIILTLLLNVFSKK